MKIKIEIEAAPAEGKTTIALIIADALIKAGIGVNVQDPDVLHGSSYPQLQAKRVAALASRGMVIDIETVQVRPTR